MNIHTFIIIGETYKNCSLDPLFLPIAIATTTTSTYIQNLLLLALLIC